MLSSHASWLHGELASPGGILEKHRRIMTSIVQAISALEFSRWDRSEINADLSLAIVLAFLIPTIDEDQFTRCLGLSRAGRGIQAGRVYPRIGNGRGSRTGSMDLRLSRSARGFVGNPTIAAGEKTLIQYPRPLGERARVRGKLLLYKSPTRGGSSNLIRGSLRILGAVPGAFLCRPQGSRQHVRHGKKGRYDQPGQRT